MYASDPCLREQGKEVGQVYGQGLTRIERAKVRHQISPGPVKSCRQHERPPAPAAEHLADTCWIASHDTSGFCLQFGVVPWAFLGLKSGDPDTSSYTYAGSFALQYPDVSRWGDERLLRDNKYRKSIYGEGQWRRR